MSRPGVSWRGPAFEEVCPSHLLPDWILAKGLPGNVETEGGVRSGPIV